MTSEPVTPTNQRVEEIRARDPLEKAFATYPALVALTFHTYGPKAELRELLIDLDLLSERVKELESHLNGDGVPLDQLERGHYSYLQTLCKGQEINVREADIQLAAVIRENQELRATFTPEEASALSQCIPSEPDSYEETMSPNAATLALAESALAKIRALLPPKSPI